MVTTLLVGFINGEIQHAGKYLDRVVVIIQPSAPDPHPLGGTVLSQTSASSDQTKSNIYLPGNLELRQLPKPKNLVAMRSGPSPESDTSIDIKLFDHSDRAIVVNSMTIDIVKRKPSVQVTEVSDCRDKPCASATKTSGPADSPGKAAPPLGKPEIIGVDLNSDIHGSPASYFWSNKSLPFSVTRADPIRARLRVDAQDCNCQWRIVVGWQSSNGSSAAGKLDITRGANPFQSNASHVGRHFYLENNNGPHYIKLSMYAKRASTRPK